MRRLTKTLFACLTAVSLQAEAMAEYEQAPKLFDINALSEIQTVLPCNMGSVATKIRSTKMAVGNDRKIYFNTSVGNIYRVSENGNAEFVAVVPNSFTTYGDKSSDRAGGYRAFTPGIAFDFPGNMYVSNLDGVYRVSAQQLNQVFTMDIADAVVAEKVATLPPTQGPGTGFIFPFSLAVSNNGQTLYLNDAILGNVWTIDLSTLDPETLPQLWARADTSDAPYAALGQNDDERIFEGKTSNNLFGAGFAAQDMAIDLQNKYLYFGHGGNGNLIRVGINHDGTAGDLEILAEGIFPRDPNDPSKGDTVYSMNGTSYDAVRKKIYVSAPWKDFKNGQYGEDSSGVPGPDVTIGGGIWEFDIKEYEQKKAKGQLVNGLGELKLILIDPSIGTAVDVVNGFNFGTDPENQNKFYVSDAGFDSGGDGNGNPRLYGGIWPNTPKAADAVPAGAWNNELSPPPFICAPGQTPAFGTADPQRAGTGEGAAIRVVQPVQ